MTAAGRDEAGKNVSPPISYDIADACATHSEPPESEGRPACRHLIPGQPAIPTLPLTCTVGESGPACAIQAGAEPCAVSARRMIPEGRMPSDLPSDFVNAKDGRGRLPGQPCPPRYGCRRYGPHTLHAMRQSFHSAYRIL